MSQSMRVDLSPRDAPWTEMIPEHEWAIYKPLLRHVLNSGIPFALGGGFAFSAYVRRWRSTKDIDLYHMPQDRDALIKVITQAGFDDFYHLGPYDRKWIYRSIHQGLICDLIWQMANGHAQVDEAWMSRAPSVNIRGLTLKVLPVEELIWAKIFVLQRDRCDWPDLFNLIYSQGATLDWEYLLGRLGEQAPMLAGVLCIMKWMCPGQVLLFPDWLWKRLGIGEPEGQGKKENVDLHRVRLLDSRDWFGPQFPPTAEKGHKTR